MVHYTRSQKLVLDVLRSQAQPLSAQEIFLELRGNSQSVGLASVYRALDALRTEGALQSVNLDDNQAYYQIAPTNGHSHHHLICTQCRKVLQLPHCPVGELEAQLSQQYHFVIENHVLDFYGVCADCRR